MRAMERRQEFDLHIFRVQKTSQGNCGFIYTVLSVHMLESIYILFSCAHPILLGYSISPQFELFEYK